MDVKFSSLAANYLIRVRSLSFSHYCVTM